MPKPRTEFLLVEAPEFTEFEWDEDKRALNWDVHEIDFDDAKTIFLGPYICAPSNRIGEER